MAKQPTMEIKVNKELGLHKAGETVHVPINKWGKPTDRFWRKRLRDAPIDNCVTVVEPSEPEPKRRRRQNPKLIAKSNEVKT